MRYLLPFWLCVLGVTVFAQGGDDVEQRIRALEAKAARADVLAERVDELEARLRGYETAEADLRLEQSVNALLGQDTPKVSVLARRAQMLTVGGQVRMRAEYRTISLYEAPEPEGTDEDFTIQRTRVNFDARLLPKLRAFVEIQDSRTWGEEQTVLTDLQGVDLHQGFVDFEEPFGLPFTFRPGRFEMTLWNQRLISPLDWHPVARAWGGILLFGTTGEFEWLGGYQLIAEDPVLDSDEDGDFYWLSSTYRGIKDAEIGGAFFWWDSEVGATDFAFGTATLHAQARFGGFDGSIDLVGQWGESQDLDVEAYAAAVTLGYSFDCSWSPRIGVEWTWASGDDDPNDGELGTFNPLFPFSHYYQGYLDLVAWRNSHDLALHLEAKPHADWWLELAFHSFWLDDSSDGWFKDDGTRVRFDPTADDDHLGYELDLSAKYWFSKDIWLWFGYSHFFPGDYVSNTGDAPDTDWLWLQLTAGF